MKATATSIILKFKKVHGDKYNYDQVNYINSKTKVKITCVTHGIFEQRPDHHLEGKGCFKCGKGGKKFDLKYIIQQFHDAHPKGLYDYSQVKYTNSQSNVKIICNRHQTYFYQTVSDHKRGYGCPMCKGKLPKDNRSIKDLILDIFGNSCEFIDVDWEQLKLSSTINYRCRNNIMHTKTIRNLLINGC